MRQSKINLCSIVLATVVSGYAIGLVLMNAAAVDQTFDTVPKLFDAAKELESVHMQVTPVRNSHADQRTRMLFMFAREPKGEICDSYYNQVLKTIDDYRIKAYNYVADCKKPVGWFGGIIKMVGGPLNGLKSLGRFDPYLRDVTDRYEQQAPSKILNETDVDCDLMKFQVRILHRMLYILKADIKYFAVERHEVVNVAVFRQLAPNKFIAGHNFYDIVSLTQQQSLLLRNFYLSRINLEQVTVGEAIEHFKPSSFIIGRLLDSCRYLLDYEADWREIEPKREMTCRNSLSDRKDNALFASDLRLSDFEDTVKFCGPFLASL